MPVLITPSPAELELAMRAERALVREMLIAEGQQLPRVATARLEEWTSTARVLGLSEHDPTYWRQARDWLRRRVGLWG